MLSLSYTCPTAGEQQTRNPSHTEELGEQARRNTHNQKNRITSARKFLMEFRSLPDPSTYLKRCFAECTPDSPFMTSFIGLLLIPLKIFHSIGFWFIESLYNFT